MLRYSQRPWWRRIFEEAAIPQYLVVRPPEARRCPECRSGYEIRDRYCPACHALTPEWRFG